MTDSWSAIRIDRHGGPEVLELVSREPVTPAADEVVVEVAAAGINYIDIYLRTGAYPSDPPYYPGGEGSGTVIDVGENVADIAAGDRVAWQAVPGSYASHVAVPAAQVLQVPADVSDLQAAALPLQGLTAHYLAMDSYPISAGDVVLVHAGAGGVGILLTQIAKHRDARVITTVSTQEKTDISTAAGADRVAAYEEFEAVVAEETDGRGVQAVYDGVGRTTFERSLGVLARRGTLVLFGQSSGPVAPIDPDVLRDHRSLTLTRPTLRDFVSTPTELRSRADQLFGLVRDGVVKAHIGATYPLAEAREAHADLEARTSTGKVLLLPRRELATS